MCATNDVCSAPTPPCSWCFDPTAVVKEEDSVLNTEVRSVLFFCFVFCFVYFFLFICLLVFVVFFGLCFVVCVYML